MRRIAIAVMGFILCAFFAATIAHAAEKFAYVDLSKLFAEYKKTQDYDKVLASKENVYTAERDKKVNEVKSYKDKYDLLSDKEKASKEEELKNKLKTLEEYDRQKQTDLRKEQDEKMKEILKDIEEAVKKYAEKEGYTMVFNNRVLVYESKSMDITDPILTILNKGKK